MSVNFALNVKTTTYDGLVEKQYNVFINMDDYIGETFSLDDTESIRMHHNNIHGLVVSVNFKSGKRISWWTNPTMGEGNHSEARGCLISIFNILTKLKTNNEENALELLRDLQKNDLTIEPKNPVIKRGEDS